MLANHHAGRLGSAERLHGYHTVEHTLSPILGLSYTSQQLVILATSLTQMCKAETTDLCIVLS